MNTKHFRNLKRLIQLFTVMFGYCAAAQAVPCVQKLEVAPVYSNDFGTGAATAQDPNVVGHAYEAINPNDGFYTVTRSLSQTSTYVKTELNGDKDAGYNIVGAGSTDGRYLAINVASAATLNSAIYRIANLGVTIGVEYRFRIDMAGLFNGTQVPSLRLNIRDSNNNVLATASSVGLGVLNDDIWRRLQLSFIANTSTVSLEIINLQPNGNDGNDVGIDNIVFAPLECDTDGDGIVNSLDLDDDNDGILDSDEGCGASVITGAVNDAAALNNLRNNNTAIFPLVPVNAVLPNGGVRVTKNSGGNGWQFFTPSVSTATITANGVTSAPFATTYLDIFENGSTPGVARNVTIDFGISANALATVGNDYQYIIGIAGMGGPENHSVTSTFSVPLTVIGNSNVFSSNLYSLIDGVPSTTAGLTGTQVSTNTPITTVQGYTYYFIPKSASSFTMDVVGTPDQHGFIFGIYSKNCIIDSDNDGIPNSFEVDSDNDGCADAVEGSENVRITQIHSLGLPSSDANFPYRGQIKVLANGSTAGTPAQIISTVPAANGVPRLVNNLAGNTPGSAGIVDATDGTSEIGQGIGTSQNANASDAECGRCFRPAATVGTAIVANHGITALGRAGVVPSNWPMKLTGAYTVLDAKTKGFVINRMPTASLSSITPVTGMMVYDTTAGCLKIYDGTGWFCYTKQTCDNFIQ